MPDTVHVVPHAPQFFGSVFVSTQVPLHTDCPVGHTHWLLVQEAPVAHAVVQLPQCAVLAVMSTHWLFVPHGPRPAAHWHAPIQHDWSLGHAWPQLPQFDELPLVSTHDEPQVVSVPAHPDPHLLPEQTSPVPHIMPQAPQFLPSEVVSTQAPEQIVWPAAQPQVPF